jgi:hypothetical protein
MVNKVNNKLIAVVAAVLLIIVAAGAFMIYSSEGDEKKGLYRLDPVISMVDMGKCSATPAVIVTLEDMYRDYYGDLVKGDLTLADAQADTDFWKEFCEWAPIITAKPNGTYDVKISTGVAGQETVTKNIPVCDTAVIMGTMYSETLYYLACKMYDLEIYSEESYTDPRMADYMNSTIAGGMLYSYFDRNNVDYMLRILEMDPYSDLGVTTVQSMDSEKLTSVLKDANGRTDGNVVYFASGARMTSNEHYNNNTRPCDVTDSYYAFFSPSKINDVFASVECIGLLMGFSEETLYGLIEDIQLRLYKVYYSVQEKTAGKGEEKIYWEGNSGRAVNSTMASVISEFLGFDSSLLNGAEQDIESLLAVKPTYIVFYKNDGRSIDELMRVKN